MTYWNVSALIIKLLLRPLNQALSRLENRVTQTSNIEYPPIFIIGPPRSGSTLLYQALVNAYKVGYLANLHCLLFGAPSWLEKQFHLTEKEHYTAFESTHGKTRGWLSPSECGDFWYRFFRRHPQHVTLKEIHADQLQKLRASVGAFIMACDRPVLFKNLMNSVRLQPLAAALPEAIFIVMRRNLVDNAQSLLGGRKAVYGHYRTWWSLEPPQVDALKELPPHQQVVEQVIKTYDLIEQEAQAIGSSRFCYVSYESFCADTSRTLQELDAFFQQNHLALRQVRTIPSTFPIKRSVRIERELYKDLNTYAQQRLEERGY